MLSSVHLKKSLKSPMKVLLVEDSALLRDVVAENLKDCKQLSIGQFSATQRRARMPNGANFPRVFVAAKYVTRAEGSKGGASCAWSS